MATTSLDRTNSNDASIASQQVTANTSAAGTALDSESITRSKQELLHQSHSTYTAIPSQETIENLDYLDKETQKAAIKFVKREKLEKQFEEQEALSINTCASRKHIEVGYASDAGLEAANRGWVRNALSKVFGKGNHAMLRQWHKANSIANLEQPEATEPRAQDFNSVVKDLKDGVLSLDITYEFNGERYDAKELKLVSNIEQLLAKLEAEKSGDTEAHNLIEQEMASIRKSPELVSKLKAFSTVLVRPDALEQMRTDERAQRHSIKSLTEGGAEDSWWIAPHRESSYSRTVAGKHEIFAFQVKLPHYDNKTETWSLIETSASLARPK